MTSPRFGPHQVRQHLDLRDQDTRTLTLLRAQTPIPETGAGQGLPIMGEVTFHFPTGAGALVSGVSDSRTVRFPCTVASAVIDVTTFTNAFTIVVLKNGTTIPGLTCAISAAGHGQRFLCNPTPLVPYVDTLAVNATSPGTGNLGVLVHVELYP